MLNPSSKRFCYIECSCRLVSRSIRWDAPPSVEADSCKMTFADPILELWGSTLEPAVVIVDQRGVHRFFVFLPDLI